MYLSVGGRGVGDAFAKPFSQYRMPEKCASRVGISAMAGAAGRIASAMAGCSSRRICLWRCLSTDGRIRPRSGMVLCLSPRIRDSRGDVILEYLEALTGLWLSPGGRTARQRMRHQGGLEDIRNAGRTHVSSSGHDNESRHGTRSAASAGKRPLRSNGSANAAALACIIVSLHFADGTLQDAEQDAEVEQHQQPQAQLLHAWHGALRPLPSATGNFTTGYPNQAAAVQSAVAYLQHLQPQATHVHHHGYSYGTLRCPDFPAFSPVLPPVFQCGEH